MTQEKQNSIRILQNKPTKKNLTKSSVFLLGFFVGLIFSAILFLIFFNSDRVIEIENNTSEVVHQNELEKVDHSSSESNYKQNEDNDSYAYKQHVNEKDLKNLFKHENKTQEPKTLNKSPFEQITGSENKTLQTASHTQTKPPLTKPITKEANLELKTKKKTVLNTEKKEINITGKVAEEVSPAGSVQVSIDRRELESKP